MIVYLQWSFTNKTVTQLKRNGYVPLKFPVQISVRIIGPKTVQILMQVYDPIDFLVFRPFSRLEPNHMNFRSMSLLIFDRIILIIL